MAQATTLPAEAHCPVCACPLEGEVRRCPRCATPHHGDCWDYAGGCAIFGCDSRGWKEPVDLALLDRLQESIATIRTRWRIYTGLIALFALAIILEGVGLDLSTPHANPLAQLGLVLRTAGLVIRTLFLIVTTAYVTRTRLLEKNASKEEEALLRMPGTPRRPPSLAPSAAEERALGRLFGTYRILAAAGALAVVALCACGILSPLYGWIFPGVGLALLYASPSLYARNTRDLTAIQHRIEASLVVLKGKK